MNEIPITYYLKKVTSQSIYEASIIASEQESAEFFQFMLNYMTSLKKQGFTFVDIENQQHQEIFLYAFCAGVATQIERQKTPVSKYIKDNEHIFVEFEVDGQVQRANVPKSFTNKQIKRILSEITGKPFNGNFRKISEFEQKKFLKEFEGIGI